MAFDYSKLKGRIVEKFGSQTGFSSFLGTAKQTVNSKLTGKVEFTKKDIVVWSQALCIPEDEIGSYFFTLKVSETETTN